MANGGSFTVNTIDREDRAIVRKFTKPVEVDADAMTLNGFEFRDGLTGAPILAMAVAYVDCEVRQRGRDGWPHLLHRRGRRLRLPEGRGHGSPAHGGHPHELRRLSRVRLAGLPRNGTTAIGNVCDVEDLDGAEGTATGTPRVRWLIAAVALFVAGVAVGVAGQRSVDSDARRAASVSAFRRDVTVGQNCGMLPATPVLAPVNFSLGPAYDWSEGRQLWGTLTVYNDGDSEVRIERLDVVWDGPVQHNVPLQIAIRQTKALPNGCVPRPVDDGRGTLPSGPVTLSPGQSASFEYSIVMLQCRGLSPGTTFGGPSPFRWSMERDGERFRFEAGPSDDLYFQIGEASACSAA